MIKKILWLSLLLLAACGGTGERSTNPAPAPTAAPIEEEDTAATASKPQLVEFYADW